MEKSIELIWKEGFLKNDALVAPRLNNLYNQKSQHAIDKFKRMGKSNLYAIVIGGSLVWIASYFMGALVAGSIIYAMLLVLVIIGKKRSNELEKINNGSSSYEYLKSFNDWLKESISIYGKMYQFFYPIFFLTIILGFLYSGMDPFNNGEFVSKIINDPNTILLYGVPVFWVLGLVLVVTLAAIFSPRLYKWDIYIVYGRIFRKLEDMLAEMEELRA